MASRFSAEILAVITAVEWDSTPMESVHRIALYGGIYDDTVTPTGPRKNYVGRIKSDVTLDKKIGLIFWGEDSEIDFGFLDVAIEDQPEGLIDFAKNVTIAQVDLYRIANVIIFDQWTADDTTWTVDDVTDHTADGWVIGAGTGAEPHPNLLASARSSDIAFVDEYTIRFRLESILQGSFDTPINSLFYDATYPQLDGKPYPIAWGLIDDPAQLLPAVFVDAVTLLYHITDLTITSFESVVYDRGTALNETTNFTATANGFTLLQNPDGRITAGRILMQDPEDTPSSLLGLFRVIRLAMTRAGIWANVDEAELTALETALAAGDLFPQFFAQGVVSLKEFLSVLDGFALWYYVDEQSNIHFGQLSDPGVESPTLAFADTNIIGSIDVEDDKAPGLSTRISHGENPGVYGPDEVAPEPGVSNADRVLMTNPIYTNETTMPVLTFYGKAATREPIKLALAYDGISDASATIAKAEVDRWWSDLYPQRRRFYTFSVPINDVLFDNAPLPQLGTFCTLQSDTKKLLESPINLLIRRTRYNFSTGLLLIQGWG